MIQYIKAAVIECDASTRGLGAMLTQKGKPICFVSRTLTDTEEKYHPMELECLAVVFACSKFDQYIYGKTDLQIFSDHRPLESIFKKEMEKSPLRLQKMLLSLQRYGFNLEYRPGKEQVVADMLSRAPAKEKDPTAEQHKTKIEVFLADIDDTTHTQFTDMSDERLDRTRTSGAKDNTYSILRRMISQGWPEKRSKCDHRVKDYWTFRDELAERDGLIYKGRRLVIPSNMEKEVALALHGAHQGAETMLMRARDILYWPNMQMELQATADMCVPCQLNKPANRREPLMTHEVPAQQFSKVGTDVMYYKGVPYLILVDYMSDFIEVTRLRDETASTIIEACKEVFARHGIPRVLHSDNAPYYVSTKFREFAADWRFTHTTSSPYHSQSNGKAESAVKIIKNLFKTAEDPWKALLEWRAAPNRDFKSPAERLFSRRLRTMVPQPLEALEVQTPDLEEIAAARRERQRRMVSGYNKGARELDRLNHGQPVLLRQVNDKMTRWRPAQVLESVSNRSYLVQNDQGNIVRRNRVAIQAQPIQTNGKENRGMTAGPTVQAPRKRHTERTQPQAPLDPETPPLAPVISSSGRQIRPLRRPDYEYFA